MRGVQRLVQWLIMSVLCASPMLVRAEQQPATSPSPRAVEALQLIESNDPYQRELGFLRLEALREPGTAEAIRKLTTSRDADLRAYSIRALSAIQGAAAVPLLLETLRTDTHPRVRRAALLGLEVLEESDPAILPACIKALRDRDTEVRMTAVDIVSRVDDPRARQAIFSRFKRERREDVRRVLALAMRRLQS